MCICCQVYSVTLVVDVRKMPRSRHNPQFNRDTLSLALGDVGINYVDIPGLGGLRHPQPESPNTGWRNTSFQGYADYMLTPGFEQSLQELLERVCEQSAVLMCAEAVPWRCHRSLIADSLVVRDIAVAHILSPTRTQPHVLRPWAQVHGTRITYPPLAEEQSSRLSGRNASYNCQGEVFTGDHTQMAGDFKVGDHVEWNSEAGRVRGTIKKVVNSPITFKGYTVHASDEEPQYQIKSDKTDHIAMHKGSALTKI